MITFETNQTTDQSRYMQVINQLYRDSLALSITPSASFNTVNKSPYSRYENMMVEQVYAEKAKLKYFVTGEDTFIVPQYLNGIVDKSTY